MKLAEIYRKIISEEPYKDMGVFFESYESFEEKPLVSRCKRLDFLKKEMSNDKVSEVLAGGAIFLMNLIKIMGETDKCSFYAITFTDFYGIDEREVLVPNIFVYPGAASVGFIDKIKENSAIAASKEMKEVMNKFHKIGGEAIFDFYESRFSDSACDEEIIRVFAVPKEVDTRVGNSSFRSLRP
ncbi:hypothetical protein HUW52_12270 [Pseudomonas sp. 43A]|uniref:Imm15 family immunity protein n=1 Tax=unclassified Pseudomonas TaxID=196821 RepID=UPI001587F0BF|nr:MULTISPECIES: Imm15 family immunity protein [unclassified Pseudomonas]QKV63624.1 hypothetical protein HUW52_12270 [Pseudomonas sp. 43A]QMW08236.1 hypothetical protein H3303_20430 [Pseudomonas sp. 29A]